MQNPPALPLLSPLPQSASADPGSPRAARIAWWLGIALVAVVFFLNQFGKSSAELPPTAILPPAPVHPLQIVGKIGLKLSAAASQSTSSSGPSTVSDLHKLIADNLVASATTDLDRLRLTLLLGEFSTAADGLDRLKQLSADPQFKQRVVDADPGEMPKLVHDQIPLITKVLSASVPVKDFLTPAESAELITTHGWIGKVALARGLPTSDPARQALEQGWVRLIMVFVALGVAALLGVIAIIGCAITAIVLLATGRIRPTFIPPARGGSVFIETLPVFVAGFLLMTLFWSPLVALVAGPAAADDLRWRLAGQWLLLPLCLWALVRGRMAFADFARRIGWHKGRGFLREVACGIFGYFATLPIYGIVVLLTVLAINIQQAAAQQLNPGGDTPELPKNPVIDIILSATPFELVMFFVLATCWAPLVEETIFRGAVYRHLRSYWRVPACALLSALLFGALHGYSMLLLLPVIWLGVSFALMREWRSSLIAPMTAHFLHNFFSLVVIISLLSVLKD